MLGVLLKNEDKLISHGLKSDNQERSPPITANFISRSK